MISLPLEQWDELDVGCWLLSNGGFFVRLVEPFRYNTIDGSLLYKMNEQTLRTLYKLNHHECEIFLRRLREVIGFRKEILASQVEFRFCDGKNQASVSDVGNWDYEEVCMWLLRTGGSKLKLIEKFYLNQVNGAELLSLTKDDLSAYGFPECDQKSFLLRRQNIAENGFNFKESWNKLFVRPMGDERIGLEGHISETHSSALSSESSEADLSSSPELLPLSPESLLSFSFNEHSISEEIAESSNDLLPVLKDVPEFGTERPDIVLGAVKNAADVVTDRNASFSTNERRTTDGPDIILGSIKMSESELVKAQPDGETEFSDVDLKDTSTDVVLYEPRGAGRETDGVDIVLGPISMNESVIGEKEFELNFPGQVHIEGETNEPGNQFGVFHYSYQDNLRDTFQELHDATYYQNAWGKQNVARLKRFQIPCRMKRQPSLGTEGATHEYQPQQDEQKFGPMNLLEPNKQSFSETIQQKVGTHQFREHQVSQIQEVQQGEGPNLKLQNVELIQIFQLSPERERQNAHVMHQNVLQALNQNDKNKSQMIQHDTSQTFQGLQMLPHFLQAENSYGQNKRVFIYVKDFDHAVPLEGRQDVEECAGYLLTSQLAILPTLSLLLQYSTTLLHIQTLSFMILHSTMLAALYMRLLRFEPAKPALVMRNHHQQTCERRKLPSIICRSTSMCVL